MRRLVETLLAGADFYHTLTYLIGSKSFQYQTTVASMSACDIKAHLILFESPSQFSYTVSLTDAMHFNLD